MINVYYRVLKVKRIFLYTILGIVILGCNQQNNDLNVRIIRDDLCIFTNKEKDYGVDDFLVHIGKVDYSKEYKSEYEKSYDNTTLPVEEKNCVLIPLKKIEKNKAYTITLSTINQTFSSNICILDKNNIFFIKKVSAGKNSCD